MSAEEDVGSQVLWRSALAKMHSARDGSAEAAALAQEAASLAATTDMLGLHGAAVLDLARVHALLNGGAAPRHSSPRPRSCSSARATWPHFGAPQRSSPASSLSVSDPGGTPSSLVV